MSLLQLVVACCALPLAVRAQPATSDKLLYSCTFEDDYPCGGIVVQPDSNGFTWTRWTGSTPSLNTGPDWDHTLGPNITTGHYMYTEATGFNPGEIAILHLPSPLALTPAPPQGGPICLTFWRHMYGMHIGTMNVTQTLPGQETQVLWSLSGNKNYSWDQTNVTLRSSGGSFGDVAFVGVRGGADIGQPYGDMAIDDVFIYDGSCGVDSTSAAPTTTTTSPTTTTSTTTATTTPTTTTPTTTSSTTTTPTTTTPTTTTTATSTTTTTPSTTSTTPTTTLSTTTSPTTITSTTTTPSTTTSTAPAAPTHTPASTSPSSGASTPTVAGSSHSPTSAVAPTLGVPSGLAADTGSGAPCPGLWGVSSAGMIVILAILSSLILLLVLALVVLSCCLCAMRREHRLQRAIDNYRASSSTLDDGVAIVGGARGLKDPPPRVYEEY